MNLVTLHVFVYPNTTLCVSVEILDKLAERKNTHHIIFISDFFLTYFQTILIKFRDENFLMEF